MLRVNSPTVGDELRTVIFTDVKAIFTAVTGEQRREVYSIRVSKFELIYILKRLFGETSEASNPVLRDHKYQK